MIEFSNNTILINRKEIELPIRINEIIEFREKIILNHLLIDNNVKKRLFRIHHWNFKFTFCLD